MAAWSEASFSWQSGRKLGIIWLWQILDRWTYKAQDTMSFGVDTQISQTGAKRQNSHSPEAFVV